MGIAGQNSMSKGRMLGGRMGVKEGGRLRDVMSPEASIERWCYGLEWCDGVLSGC